MKAVVQRVSSATVYADGEFSGQCGQGLLILLGVAKEDTEEDALLLAEKISKLRVFTDDMDKMNLSLKDIDGEALVVSNFTLNANYSHGNRPEYFASASPDEANRLYLYFLSLMQERIRHVGHGKFGASMKIDMSADGPVTIVMDSDCLKKKGARSHDTAGR